MSEAPWTMWRILKGAGLVVGALIVMGALWFFIGMIVYAIDPIGDSWLGVIPAIAYYSFLFFAAIQIGRWVRRRI